MFAYIHKQNYGSLQYEYIVCQRKGTKDSMIQIQNFTIQIKQTEQNSLSLVSQISSRRQFIQHYQKSTQQKLFQITSICVHFYKCQSI
ncbi:unnamed protein product [Paramecium sonneborni]|uniref:Uncharacterized protein n=1 Tax=Paramecium sonneborni TaxID=65129 RepID=A0A8S1LV04_9CILI|nr:unnamed protein product [Paramecium sonneborni]